MTAAITFSTTDPDELRDMLCRSGWGDHTRVVREKGDFLYRSTAARTPRVLVDTVETRLSQVVHAAAPFPMLHIPLTGTGVYRIGRRTFRTFPGQAIALAPGHEYTLATSGGTWIGLCINPGFLSELTLHGGSRLGKSGAILSAEVPLSVEAQQALARTVSRLLRADVRTEPDTDDEANERQLGRWLSTHITGGLATTYISPKNRARLRAINGWIDRHFREPVSLAQMCEAIRISKRSMQYLCRLGHGMTPMEVLQQRRLAAVRMALERAGPGAVITKTALENGFTHLGRFSIMYREVYGESPSATVARSRTDRRCVRPPQGLAKFPPALRQLAHGRNEAEWLQLAPPGINSIGPELR